MNAWLPRASTTPETGTVAVSPSWAPGAARSSASGAARSLTSGATRSLASGTGRSWVLEAPRGRAGRRLVTVVAIGISFRRRPAPVWGRPQRWPRLGLGEAACPAHGMARHAWDEELSRRHDRRHYAAERQHE